MLNLRANVIPYLVIALRDEPVAFFFNSRGAEMKSLTAIALLLATVSGASAQYIQQTNPYGLGTGSNPNNHYVQPHVTQQGTYVAPHYQTNPNNTQMDNYGTRGNVNPYTGQMGTRNPRF